jgi:Putative transposase
MSRTHSPEVGVGLLGVGGFGAAFQVTRPPVAIERLSLTSQGQVKYSLKTPYRDGATHVIFAAPQ